MVIAILGTALIRKGYESNCNNFDLVALYCSLCLGNLGS